MSEIWKPVVGFEGYYEVSNYGVIRSIPRTIHLAKKGGGTFSKSIAGVEKKPSPPTHSGHINIVLYKNNRPTTRQVHHLVLEAFVGPRPIGMECAHGDGRPSNNRLDNLRWDTHVNNCADRVRHGTETRGVKNPGAKLSEADVLRIREMTQREAVDMFQVSQSTVSLIHSNKRWKHI